MSIFSEVYHMTVSVLQLWFVIWSNPDDDTSCAPENAHE